MINGINNIAKYFTAVASAKNITVKNKICIIRIW